MKAQRKLLVLYSTLTIGGLLLCLLVGYGWHKRDAHPSEDKHSEEKPLSPEPTDNAPTQQPLILFDTDGTLLPYYDPQVKTIYSRWQSIRQFTWEKDYAPLCQARYLYRKGHYIYASALATFNVGFLPLLWCWVNYLFWNEPVMGIIKANLGVNIAHLLLWFVVIYQLLYRPVYSLVERFIGVRLLIKESERKETVDLLAEIQALLAQQSNLPSMDQATIDKMGAHYNTLLELYRAYANAVETEALALPQSASPAALKEKLEKHKQIWIAKYDAYIGRQLLEKIANDLAAKIELLSA